MQEILTNNYKILPIQKEHLTSQVSLFFTSNNPTPTSKNSLWLIPHQGAGEARLSYPALPVLQAIPRESI